MRTRTGTSTRSRAWMPVLALALLGAGCAGQEVRFAATAGETLEIDLMAELGAVPTGGLPDGATIDATGHFAWTPSADQTGEHVIPVGETDVEATLVIEVTEAEGKGGNDPRIRYGGCDCGWTPEPPNPRPRATEMAGAGAILLAFLARRRRMPRE